MKWETKRRENLIDEIVGKFRTKIKALERQLVRQQITKVECRRRLLSLKENLDVFKANITGHKKFLYEITSRIESISRACVPAMVSA